MSIKIPYSQIALGNLVPATASNFPALKHFWPCNQSEIGFGFLTDSIAGVKLNKSAGTIATPASPDGFSVYPNQVVTGTTITGTLTVPGNKNCILLAVGQFGTNGFGLGNPVGSVGAINVTQPQTAALMDGTNTLNNSVNGAFTNSASIYGRALAVTWSGNAQSFEATTTTTITTKTGTAISTATPGTMAAGIAALDNTWSCGSTVTNLYGAAFLVFNGALPPATFIASMLAWTTYQWSIGNKVIYPGLKGVS